MHQKVVHWQGVNVIVLLARFIVSILADTHSLEKRTMGQFGKTHHELC